MNETDKLLQRLSAKERQRIEHMLLQLALGQLLGLPIKKIVGTKDIFRLRVGRYRIIYRQSPGHDLELIKISKRNEKTYKDL